MIRRIECDCHPEHPELAAMVKDDRLVIRFKRHGEVHWAVIQLPLQPLDTYLILEETQPT